MALEKVEAADRYTEAAEAPHIGVVAGQYFAVNHMLWMEMGHKDLPEV